MTAAVVAVRDMDVDLDSLRNKLNGLAGSQLADDDVASLLAQVIDNGGGVSIELDNVRYKLIRRDGHFVVAREPRTRASSTPPRL